MKRLLFILLLFLVGHCSFGQITFQKAYGGTSTDIGLFAEQTTDGGYIISGFTQSFGPGTQDAYLIKTDANGDTLWTKAFGGAPSWEKGYMIHQTFDGGYIITGRAGSFGAGGLDVYLAKTDGTGNMLWSRTYGGTINEEGLCVQQCADSSYIIVGYESSFGSGWDDVYLIKADPNGDTLWTKTYGVTFDERGASVKPTSDGGYIISGYAEPLSMGNQDLYLIKTDSIGDTLWTKIYGGSFDEVGQEVQQTSDGGYIITGSGQNKIYLIKTDANGDSLWTHSYQFTFNQSGTSVLQCSDNGYIIGGTMSYGNNADAFLIRTDSLGNVAWSRTYGGPDDEYVNSVQQCSDGGYIIAGWTKSYGSGFEDVYLIKTDSLGNSGGCNDSTANVIMGNPSLMVSSGGIVNAGAIVTNPPTINMGTATVDTVICYCDTLLAVAMFNYIDSLLTVVFSDSSISATTWFWDFGDGNNASIPNPTHIYANPGIYNVCLIVTNACGSDTMCDTVVVGCPLPIAGFTYINSLLTVNFTDITFNTNTWYWDFGDGNTDTIQNPIHIYTNPGTYWVCLYATNTCGTDSICDSITVTDVGINQQSIGNNQFTIHPNPTSGVFTVQGATGEIQVYDLFGRTVLTTTKPEIDMRGYAKGVYFIKVGEVVRKLVLH